MKILAAFPLEMMKKKIVMMELMMKGIEDPTIPLIVKTGERMQTQKMRVRILRLKIRMMLIHSMVKIVTMKINAQIAQMNLM